MAFLNGGTEPRGREFVEAVRKMAALAGVDSSQLNQEELTPEEAARVHEQERRALLFETFLEHTRESLLSDAGVLARTYLISRCFEDSWLKEMDLGLYTTREAVRRHLAEAGFTAEEVEKSGLAYDGRWEGRLVGAWRDRWGRIGTFWARDLTGKAEEAEKYLYLTTKAKWGGKQKAELVAFGLDAALRTDAGRRKLVMVEGFLDVLSLQARGFTNVAAIGGSGEELSAGRLKALRSYGVRSVTLALDYDPKPEPCKLHNLAYCYPCSPGLIGTLKALDRGRDIDNAPDVYVVAPLDLYEAAGRPTKDGSPAKVDPDELVCLKDLDSFRAVLETRRAATLFLAFSILGNVSTPDPVEKRKQTAEELLDMVGGLRGHDRLYGEEILSCCCERLKFPREILDALAEELTERRQREGAEQEALALLRRGQDELSQRHDLTVIPELCAKLSAVRTGLVDAPPPYQVDRLDAESRKLPAGKRSGWSAVDDDLEVHFNPGELAVIAGRTGHLKTSFLVGIFANQLREVGDEVFVFHSAEEPEISIYHRLLALLSVENGDSWSTSEVRDYLRDEHSRSLWPNPQALVAAREMLRSWEGRCFVVHRPLWTVADIETHARSLADRHKVGAIFIDYLQRIPPPPGPYDRRDIEVSIVGRHLKSLAVELSVPVLVAAQINREAVPPSYGKALAGKTYAQAKATIRKARPDLHHLREGGSEQEADLVLGLLNYAADYRREVNQYVNVPKVTLLEVGTLKQRHGASGKWAELALEGQAQMIRDSQYEGEV